MKPLVVKSFLFVSFSLLGLLLHVGCRKDAAIEDSTNKPVTTNVDKWLKTSDFILQQEVYDCKKLINGNMVVLADNYYIFDSMFRLVLATNLYQSSMSIYQAKRLSNPFYTNKSGADGKTQYLIQHNFDEADGKINAQSVVDFNAFFDVSNNGYGILLDDKEDKILKNSIRLFLKTDQDTIPNRLKQICLFTKREAGSSNNIIQKEVGTAYNRIACTKRNYLLYSSNSFMGLNFIDASFNQIDTNIYKSEVELVFATDDAFYIKNSYGLFKTQNGESFLNITQTFKPMCLLNNELMFGINNEKPCVFNLITQSFTYLPADGLPRTYFTKSDYAIGINNTIVLFTKEGVYQLKY